jgi:hypothetical protein
LREAYNYYLRGRFYWNKRAPDALHRAIDCYDEALSLDAGYALAHAGKADCFVLLADYALVDQSQALKSAKDSAAAALAFDESLAEAHKSMGFVLACYDHDWIRAEQHFQRARDLRARISKRTIRNQWLMTKRSDQNVDAKTFLHGVVQRAAEGGATMVEFERVPDGLEITAFAGQSGIGNLVDDRELESAIFELVDAESKTKRDGTSTIEMVIHGEPRMLGVQWYDSFGEACFRLYFDQTNARSDVHASDHWEADALEPPFDILGECAGCDTHAPLDRQGLCEECADKLERDLIRLGDWDYTAIGFGLPEHQRESYRERVIAEFGWEMELIADERPSTSKPRKKRARKKKQKRRRAQ